jgi:site-specific DNA-methyltransferase (adenine-specific)
MKIEPYYKNKLTTIYNGDCLDVMDYLIEQGVKVDAIITDPPYGMNYDRHIADKRHDKIKNDTDLSWLPEVMIKYRNILKDNSPIFMFCSYHNIDTFKREFEKHFKLRNLLIWDKRGNGMGDLDTTFGATYEMILYGNVGRVELNGGRDRDVIYSNRSGNNLHPTEKPLDIITYLIEKVTKENDLILDGFSGSFTTSCASEQLNRRSIGIELEKKYCDVGVKRLSQLQMMLDI